MAVEREQVQMVMLRVLGVLLVVVGFTMIARSAESPAVERSRAVAVQVDKLGDRCERVRVDVQSIHRHVLPKPPRPPKPPTPPSAPTFVFVN